MRIIPVLDVKGGRAVRAVAGDRDHYGTLVSVLHPGSDPIDLARAFRDRLDLDELYLADLDALDGRPPDRALYRKLADLGLLAWIDAGIRRADDLNDLRGGGLHRIILGSETLEGPDALTGCLRTSEGPGLAFSLDLKAGRPLLAPGADWGTDAPLDLAAAAIERGVRSLIVLDLARVGTARGPGTLDLLRAIRDRAPAVELIAGGGVAGPSDLDALEAAGADAALVGCSIHDGRLDLARGSGLAPSAPAG